jgi:hypothetical protein
MHDGSGNGLAEGTVITNCVVSTQADINIIELRP